MDSKEFNGKKYQFGGAFPTKQKANQHAKAMRRIGYFARIDREHFSDRGTIPHPEDVKAGRIKTTYRLWIRKNPEHEKPAACRCRRG